MRSSEKWLLNFSRSENFRDPSAIDDGDGGYDKRRGVPLAGDPEMRGDLWGWVDWLAGLGAGVVFGFLLRGAAAVHPAMTFLSGFPLVAIYGLVVPIVEEWFFCKITATTLERAGVVIGTAVPVIAWVLFHYSVVGLTGSMLPVLIAFGLFRSMTLLFTKCFVPANIAHALANTISVM